MTPQGVWERELAHTAEIRALLDRLDVLKAALRVLDPQHPALNPLSPPETAPAGPPDVRVGDGSVRLFCDCGTGFQVDRHKWLVSHTLTAHGRQPTTTERTPRSQP